MAGGIFIGTVPIIEVIHGLPDAPTVSIAPIDPSVVEGDTINFVATATGYGALNYQWMLDGAPIAGAVAATYDRVSVLSDNGLVITCQVSDNHSQVVVSAPSTMTVAAAAYAPIVVTHPAAQTVANGVAATFTAAFDGDPVPTVQWAKGGVDIAGATALSYTTPVNDYLANNGDSFTCTATNSEGSVTTNAAVLTVSIPAVPTITIAPTAPSVTEGDVIPFVATAAGYGTLTYQWKVNGAEIGGATAAAYNHTALLTENGYGVECVVTDAAAQVVVSAVSIMAVVAAEIVQAYNITVGTLGGSSGWGSLTGAVFGTIDRTDHTPYELMEISSFGSVRIVYNFGGIPGAPTWTKIRATTSTGIITEVLAAEFDSILVGGVWGAHIATSVPLDIGADGTVTLFEFVMS